MSNINNYKVVLLSAGVARRMGHFTNNRPKSLLKLNGISLIKRIILILKKRKIKELAIIVGFKSQQIVKELKDVSGVEFKFIKIRNYRSNGHACSWHAFKNHWLKSKKPIILMHTDIYFDERYLDNILKSKKRKIIGIHSNKEIYRKDSIMVNCNKKYIVENLDYFQANKSNFGEVLGINKISKKTSENIFLFMDKFLIKDKETFMGIHVKFFLKMKKDKFHVLKAQKYIWKILIILRIIIL